ncbi:hypothetical protein BGX26_004994 [Mortierella sp. AD094]|nr:hypothetical protein BGX26_004994 [Mortierella sp. AD094]
MITHFLWVVLTVPVLISAQTGPGPCHPYPGAVAQDVLELIGNNLNNDVGVQCDASGRATISLRNGVITTACAKGVTSVATDTMVRRALTTVGSCALNDHGSVSGYYIADDGSKTCYLYAGNEGQCTL